MKNVYSSELPLRGTCIQDEPQLLWPSVLFVLFILVSILSPGLDTVLFCAFLFFPAMFWMFAKTNMPAAIPKFAGLLFLIVLVGSVYSIEHKAYDVAKDAWNILNAALALIAGYVLMLNLKDIDKLLRAFIIAATLTAIFHLLKIALHPAMMHTGDGSAMDIRAEGGAGYVAPFVAIAVFFAAKKMNIRVFGKHRWLAYVVFVLCLSSTILSFSRTDLISLVIMVCVLIGWISFDKKIKVMSYALIVGTIIVLGILFPASNAESVHSFTDKLLHSFQEIKVREYSNPLDISHNWRGFETSRALVTYYRGTLPEYIVGQGLGAPIDLGFYMALGRGTNGLVRYAPWVHNGYMYILVKTGIVGVLIYLFLIFRLIREGTALSLSASADMKYVGRLIVALALVFVVTTWVVGGMFNKGGFLPVCLLTGALLAYGSVAKSKT